MGEREISHCRDLHPTSHVQLVRLHDKVVLENRVLESDVSRGAGDLIRNGLTAISNRRMM